MFDQIIARNDMVVVFDEIFNYIKYLRLSGDKFATASQFAAVRIQKKFLKSNNQMRPQHNPLFGFALGMYPESGVCLRS